MWTLLFRKCQLQKQPYRLCCVRKFEALFQSFHVQGVPVPLWGSHRSLSVLWHVYGWACAGGISKLSWFKGNINKWEGKKLIAFCVGGSPLENPEIEPALKKNFSEDEMKKVSVFYCPGGFNYEKMSTASKLMMKMFIKTLKAKKNKTEEDEIMIKMLSSSYDISDKKYIEPILECLNEGNQL